MWRRFYLGELALTKKIGETAQRLEEPTRHTGVFIVFVLINNRGALLLSLYLFPILIREIREIRGLITSNHME